jgi:hypothetical protein
METAYKWTSIDFTLQNKGLLTDQTIERYVDKLWIELSIDKLSSELYFNVLFKVYVDNFHGYRTIGFKFRSNKDSKAEFIRYCKGNWDLKSIEYKSSNCSKISFAYRRVPEGFNINSVDFPIIKGMDKSPIFKFSGYDLPLSMNIYNWGNVVENNLDIGLVRVLIGDMRRYLLSVLNEYLLGWLLHK